jgi:peptide/nickel transport system permease protein
MGLKAFIAKRIVYMIILIWLTVTVNFLIFVMMPGSPIDQYITKLTGRMNEERIAVLKAHFGIDKPLHERYILYITNLITWNFGDSYFSGSVTSTMIDRMSRTLELMGFATTITILLGVLLGVVCAHTRGGALDGSLVSGSLVTYSVPIFWLGWIILFVFGVILKWFPQGGAYPLSWAGPGNWPTDIFTYIAGRLYHLVLPTVTLVLFSIGGWILLSRACMLESITEDYVVTARAKGLGERTVLLKHVLKNASLPIVTSVALSFAGMIGGAIITETVFNYNGMGRWTWQAIGQSDLPVLAAIFYVTTLTVILANFLADLLYGVIDPRIRYG